MAQFLGFRMHTRMVSFPYTANDNFLLGALDHASLDGKNGQ